MTLTEMMQQAVKLEAEVRYWKAEAERRLKDVQAGIADPGSLIESLEIPSQFPPPIRLNEPLRPGTGGPGLGSKVLGLVKPRVQAKFKGVERLVDIAPAGPPTENYLSWLKLGGATLGGLAVYGAFKLVWR